MNRIPVVGCRRFPTAPCPEWKQRGLSMIEILVSLTIVAFGLLGLAGLQARSMSFQKDSLDCKAATELATQLTERVMANYDGFRAGNYVVAMLPVDATPVAVPACADPQNCKAAEIAARDWAMWGDLQQPLTVTGNVTTPHEQPHHFS